MAKNSIPNDSTLIDVKDTLTDPDKFVSCVFGIMNQCKIKHGNSYLRIGVKGEGKEPYFEVFYLVGGDEFIDGTYYGLTRKDELFEPGSDAWSSKTSSYDDVRALLGVIRNIPTKLS